MNAKEIADKAEEYGYLEVYPSGDAEDRARWQTVLAALRAFHPEGGEHYDNLRRRNQVLERALIEIMKGEGAFSRDPLEHATNCIESMKGLAKEALYDSSLGGYLPQKD